MADVGATESIQLLSPELHTPHLREALKTATDHAKEKVQDFNQVIVILDCARMKQDFGLFKEANLNFSVEAQSFQEGLIQGTTSGSLILKEPSFVSRDEVDSVAQILRDKHGMNVEFSDEDGQRLDVRSGDSRVLIDFFYPSKEAAAEAYGGNAGSSQTKPTDYINLLIYPGESVAVEIENRNNTFNEAEVGRLIASVPKSLDMMTKVMEAANSVIGKDRPEKLPGIVNWTDTELSGQLEFGPIGMIYNKNHESVGTVITAGTVKEYNDNKPQV